MSFNNMKQTSEITASFEKLHESLIDYARKNDESQLITALKDLCGNWIESKRRLRNIQNIEQFLSVLKQRSKYKPGEDDFFNLLSKKIINDSEFTANVKNHRRLLEAAPKETQPLLNLYAAKRQTNGFVTIDELSPRTENLQTANFSPLDEKRNKIFDIISRGISSAEFLTLARNLNMDDNEIKEIVDKHRNYRSRTMILLETYERRHSTHQKLMHVLKFIIGRSDLVASIKSL